MKRPSWPLADDLTPKMQAALKAWPDICESPGAFGYRKDTIRALRLRGLVLPRGRTQLGDRVVAYLEREERPEMIYPGFILAQLADWARRDAAAGAAEPITIDGHQANGAHCVHQARARIKGDPTVYRILIAPADAPIFINDDKRPVADAFALPLGDS